MSFFRITAMSALAAGVLFLVTSCADRKDVAIAAKDDDIRRMDQQRAQDQADKENLSALNTDLAKQNQQLAERNAAIANEQMAKISELEAILKELSAKSAQGTAVKEDNEFAVERDSKDAIHIKVAGTLLFEPGKAELKHNAADTLKKVATTLKTKYAHNYVRIEGHTDSTPIVHAKDKYKDNMALSLARANAVYDLLLKEGLPSTRLYATGYGDSQPLVTPEKTAADRAKNRRVEIVIMPSDVKVQKEPLAAGKASLKESAKK